MLVAYGWDKAGVATAEVKVRFLMGGKQTILLRAATKQAQFLLIKMIAKGGQDSPKLIQYGWGTLLI